MGLANAEPRFRASWLWARGRFVIRCVILVLGGPEAEIGMAAPSTHQAPAMGYQLMRHQPAKRVRPFES